MGIEWGFILWRPVLQSANGEEITKSDNTSLKNELSGLRSTDFKENSTFYYVLLRRGKHPFDSDNWLVMKTQLQGLIVF